MRGAAVAPPQSRERTHRTCTDTGLVVARGIPHSPTSGSRLALRAVRFLLPPLRLWLLLDFDAVLRDELFLALVRFAAPFFGILAPASRASLNPIAIACFGFVTLCPLLPDRN